MPTEMVSPAYHFWRNVFIFHSSDGMIPLASSGRSIPVFCEADSRGVLGNGIDAEALGERVKENVTGLIDALADVDHTVNVRLTNQQLK